MDPFTQKRLMHVLEQLRARSGELPTLSDFEKSGFSKDQVEIAIKLNLIEQFYVTLNNGVIVKTFKIKK